MASSRRAKRDAKGQSRDQGDEIKVPLPVNVIDGIPARSSRKGRWEILLMLAIFAGWIAFLLFCQISGVGHR